MRGRNLFDTETAPPKLTPPDGGVTAHRTADGSFNGLDLPWMGMAGARFGRNVPIKETFGPPPPSLYEPNPRRISNELLARREFVPVPYLNVLVSGVAAVHGPRLAEPRRKPEGRRRIEVPIEPGDDWPQKPMTILRSTPGPDDSRGRRPARGLHQHRDPLVGRLADLRLGLEAPVADPQRSGDRRGAARTARSGSTPNGHLPIEPMRDETADAEDAKFPDLELAGVNGNWWLGLSVMHTLFAREHNAVVDRLKLEYPDGDGEWLFQKARLVVTALIAKIHTTEWTPSLMNSPEGRFAMRGNWWGLMGEHYWRGYGRLDDNEEISGIPGSPGRASTPRPTR